MKRYGQISKSVLTAGLAALSIFMVFLDPAYALLAEPDGFEQLARKAVQMETVERRPSALQRSTTSTIGNIDVVWSFDTGAPITVRGLEEEVAISRFMIRPDGDAAHMKDVVFGVLNQLKDVYGMTDPRSEFDVIGVERDSLGFVHVRLQQMFGGVAVAGGVLIAHFNDSGFVYEVNGKYFPGLACDVRAGISPEAAVAAAEKHLVQAAWSDFETVTEPVYVIKALLDSPRLTWELALRCMSSDGRPGLWRVWVDSADGSIVNAFDNIQKIMPPTPVGTQAELTGALLSGEGGFTTNVTGWLDELMQVYFMHNTNLFWTVMNASSTGYVDSGTFAHRFTNDWGGSDPVQMSAARGFELTQQYFTEMHGRLSFDNNGAYAKAFVHVGNSFVNAYWDGSAFYFGDGDGEASEPLAVLDVCAHEFAHAVTEHTAGLYYQNESGALNESFSDIFAALVEFHYQPDARHLYPDTIPGHADWLIGEDCWLASTALRDMRDPSSLVTVETGYQQPSRYRGTHWYTGMADNGGVHINNGVQNFFFYLLAEGGDGVNDGLEYSVEGIGITNAGQLAYRTLSVYCAPLTNFRDVREAWISAASDLNTNWMENVSDAWDAVGVPGRGKAGALAKNDYNADGITDLALYERLTGDWYILSPLGNLLAWGLNFGAASFIPVPGDYDGGGATDLAVYSEQTGEWYVAIVETGELRHYQFGGLGYAPVPGDYSGDGITDLAVYHRDTGGWYIWSTEGYIIAWGVNFGAPGFVPVPGDYDSSGETDFAVYDRANGTWYFRHIGTGLQDAGLFGGPLLVPVQGDYTGDGMTDPAVYNVMTGEWYIWSRRGYLVKWGLQFGGPGLVPVPGDYNGDGLTDVAVYQESTGRWYVYLSATGAVSCFDFGGPGLVPVGSWFWRD